MGGDQGIKITVPASLMVLAEYPELHLTLVGDQTQLQTALDAASPS